MTTIMIVEDEEKLATLLSDYLKQSGFDSLWVANGNEVLPRVRERLPDLILLDLMLPGRDGLDICKEVRTFSEVPIIMITARVEEIDRLLGLELGADDYICKPFSPREVVARVKTVLRRSGEHQAPPTGALALEAEKFRAVLNGRDLELTAVEFKLLHFLYQNPGRIYSRSQLMDRIYSDQRIVSDRTIDSHIKKLRKKIAAVAPDEELIHSIYGVGYKYEAP
ncbi:MAG: two-component system response regulator BaeR [Geobacteraceae bacterium GWC2_58_44]|nr:MAG: two-component system response regulator BaeR [Geobacteraceae bacterium GWC2_58_44]HBG05552.1 two-component system response regulator BaeR [Geobacter sp.]